MNFITAGLTTIRGGSSTDESLFYEGGRIPERTRSTSHRERENTRIYICEHKGGEIQRTEIEDVIS